MVNPPTTPFATAVRVCIICTPRIHLTYAHLGLDRVVFVELPAGAVFFFFIRRQLGPIPPGRLENRAKRYKASLAFQVRQQFADPGQSVPFPWEKGHAAKDRQRQCHLKRFCLHAMISMVCIAVVCVAAIPLLRRNVSDARRPLTAMGLCAALAAAECIFVRWRKHTALLAGAGAGSTGGDVTLQHAK